MKLNEATYSDYFRTFIRHTNQKQVSSEYIKKRLSKHFIFSEKREFVFTDVGCGSGELTLAIADFLKDKSESRVIAIEASAEMIAIFKQKAKGQPIKILQQKIEDVKLVPSDFILLSHMLGYVQELEKTIGKVYQALRPGGMALIILTSPQSDDVVAKEFAHQSEESRIVKPVLEIAKKYAHKEEIVESVIEIRDCLELNEEGKKMIAFMLHQKFEDIPKENITILLQNFKKLAKDSEITKRESFIWIYKSNSK